MNTSKPKIIIENSFSHIIQVVLNNLKMKQKIVFSFVRRLKAKNIRNDFFFLQLKMIWIIYWVLNPSRVQLID